MTETRVYNSRAQLVSQSVPGLMGMTYTYSATQNNGQITQAKDNMQPQEVNYSYDSLKRLSAAWTTNAAQWGVILNNHRDWANGD